MVNFNETNLVEVDKSTVSANTLAIKVNDTVLIMGGSGGGGGGDIDLSFITAGASDILEGKVGADVNGNPVNGTLVVGGGGGGSSVEYGYIDENGMFQTLDLSGENPELAGEASAVTSAGIFVTGQPEPEYAGGGGGGGAFDLAKVTEYTPYSASLTAITSIEVSGLTAQGSEEDGDYVDYSVANGTYFVTAETENNTNPFDRVFKHESAEWYIHSYYDSEYDEGCWYLGETPEEEMIIYVTPDPISSGTYTFDDQNWGWSLEVTLVVNETTTPEQPMVLKGVNAISYENEVWTFSETETVFTGFEKEPKINNVYTASGTSLIGNSVAFVGTIPSVGLIFYAPLRENFTDVTGNYTPVVTTATFEERLGRMAMKAANKDPYAEWSSTLPPTTGALTIFCAVTGISYSDWSGFISIGETTSELFGLDNYRGTMNGRVGVGGDWGQFGKLSTTSWDTIALTRDASGNHKMYLNKELIAEAVKEMTSVKMQFVDAGYCRGAHKGNCYISDYCTYDRALTAEEIAKLHDVALLS